jgi:FKBP-type peptidyl-prolyl cis-trans isomerase FkpA
MRLFPLASLLILAACAPGHSAALKGCRSMSASNDIPVTPSVDTTQLTRTASGLGIQELRVGTGPTAQPGNHVSVHYTGWLTDGTQFDSSREPRRPGGTPELLSFALGRQQVIDGWDEGVAGMKVGGRRKLVIPPALGYGDLGAGGVIPPGATLIFDVELCAVR